MGTKTKKKMAEVKAKQDDAKATKAQKVIEERASRTKDFSFGGEASVKLFIEELEKCADPETKIGDIKNPQKMLIILATNMDGKAVTYPELADRANAWMHDSFAVSPKSQVVKRLSDKRPISAFNGRNEIWRQQKGMAPVCVIEGQAIANTNKHADADDDPREQLDSFNLIEKAYEALTPELVGKLKQRFTR